MNDAMKQDSHDILVEADRKDKAQPGDAPTVTSDEQGSERGESVDRPKKGVNTDG